jgi:hypothetical protein
MIGSDLETLISVFFFSCVNLTNFAKLKNNRQNFDMKEKKKNHFLL